MNIHEPMTMATDFLIGAAATYFAAKLWLAEIRMWSAAFLFTALAAFLGGLHHGLAADSLWLPTVASVGLASFFLLAGTHKAMVPIAAIKFVVFAALMLRNPDFLFVILDYGVTLLVVGASALFVWIRRKRRGGALIVAAVGVSVLAALVQQSGIRLHEHFNHNDLYHLIQVVALWLLYRGRMELKTPGTARLTIQPT